ncbi:MAG TPA: PAS domain S-box protein, partial [Candidatus Moranbacteria bacterium]|nr:PAS domain S-box protein [Candidatus Moranbacteria bacterium]
RYDEMLLALMGNTPDSVYFKDREGRFLMVSEAKAEKYGVDYKEMIGKTDFDFLPMDQAEIAHSDDKKVMETGTPIKDKIEKITRPDRSEVYVSVSKTPWKNDTGEIIGLIGISRDITERIAIEKGILDMLSTATHEIRGPLVSIQFVLKLLQRGAYGKIDESARKTVEELFHRIGTLINVVTDYLSKSSLIDAKIPKKEKLDLRQDIIDRVLEEVNPEIIENQITIDNKLGSIPGNVITVEANKTWLKAVLKTLIGNGIKHGGKGGKIAIGYERGHNEILIIVWNDGPVISDKEKDKIFEKFHSKNSTGIGLYVARKLIERHGGKIWYQNSLDDHPEFVFTLPDSN